jgi:hypothetical protein
MCLASIELWNKKPRGFWEKSCNNPRYNHKLEVITAWKWFDPRDISLLNSYSKWKVAKDAKYSIKGSAGVFSADAGFHVFLDRDEAVGSGWNYGHAKLYKVEVCQLIARGYGDGIFPRLRVSTFAYMRLAKKKKGKKAK